MNNDKYVQRYLINTTPNKFDVLEFFGYFIQLTKLDFYLLALRDAISRTMQRLEIRYLIMKGTSFWILLKAAKHIETVEIKSWVILSNNQIDLNSIPDSKLKHLDLSECGKKSQWKKYPDRCINIIDGIFKSSNLMASINQLNLTKWEMTFGAQLFLKSKMQILNIENPNSTLNVIIDDP